MVSDMFDTSSIKKLQKIVWDYYTLHARDDLPWRNTHDPYHILVSEIMLQQTQVVRVIEKYHQFLEKFPTVSALAEAPLREVLIVWQGLGYNRRAKMLHSAAQVIVREHKGRVPRDYDTLRSLPGIGPYTAGAVSAFAYNIPIPIVETNIRTVLFYHLFGMRGEVTDVELLRVSDLLLDRTRPRDWYYALMDYGAHLKSQGITLNAKSKHYTKQSRFEGSDRQVRGAILRTLAQHPVLTERMLIKYTGHIPVRVRTQLAALTREGMVRTTKGKWHL
jgi:A/G-specific adenine glycosylase